MAKFCPKCGTATVKLNDGGRERDACPNGDFVQYAKVSLGVGALVYRNNAALVVERGIPPVGLWTIPSGFVEQDDNIHTAIIRELKEETGLDVIAQGVVFLRNAINEDENSMYCVFLCEADAEQEPVPDGIEATQARFVAPEEFDSINLSLFSRWLIESYQANPTPPLQVVTVPGYRPNAVVFGNLGLQNHG
jgi:ADP-ribose pyrophosphatase YjhB (NUDIX family)